MSIARDRVNSFLNRLNALLDPKAFEWSARFPLLIGATGSGKTNTAQWMQEEWIRKGKGWLSASYPHPQRGEFFLTNLHAEHGSRWFDRNVRIEQIGYMRRVRPQQYLKWSTAGHPGDRARENEQHRRRHVEKIKRASAMEDFGERHGTENYLNKLIEAAQALQGAIPEDRVCLILRNGTAEMRLAIRLLNGTHIGDWLKWRASQHGKDILAMSEAVIRFWERFYENAAIKARVSNRPTDSNLEFMNRGGVTVYLGAGGLEDALLTVVTSDLQEAQELALSRELIPGQFWLDEAFTSKMLTLKESDMMATLRDFGMGLCSCAQTLPVDEPQLLTNLNQNTDKYIFRQNDPKSADICAALLRPLLDSYRIHHTIQKQRNAGFTQVERVSVSRKHGEKAIDHETHSMQLVPILQTFAEPVYANLSQDLIELAGELMDEIRMPAGMCFIAERGQPIVRRPMPLVKDLYGSSGYRDQVLPKILERHQNQLPEVQWETQTATPITSSENIEDSGFSRNSSRGSRRERQGRSTKPANQSKKSGFRHKQRPQES